MQFNIDIKNFGKIKNAKVNIRPFTVIAGPNSSGKSFVTKALYSFFNTINNDHITSLVYGNIVKLQNLIINIQYDLPRPSSYENHLISELMDAVRRVETTIDEEFRVVTYTQQILGLPLLDVGCKNIGIIYDELKRTLEDKVKYIKVRQTFDAIKLVLNSLNRLIDAPQSILAIEIEQGFINELKENFQVSKLSDLKNYLSANDEPICFDFDSLGSFKIQDEHVSFRLTPTSIDDFQNLYNVVYLESPIYWKLKDSLENLRTSKRFMAYSARGRNDSLTGVPKHFYDLLSLVKTKAKEGNAAISSPFDNSIKEAIGGQLVISPAGEIGFKEEGSPRAVNLHSTALGVTNIGLISLLLERGVISRGSYVFIDEPEVNLHPYWQKIMIETLFELSLNGISVVLASHSIDMMKCIENIMENHPSLIADGHFGINQLNSKGNSIVEGENPLRRISAIKKDLGQSFYDMYLDGEF